MIGWSVVMILGRIADWSTYYACLHSHSSCLQNIDAIALISSWFVIGLLAGPVIGYFQSLCLKVYDFRKWIWNNILGWSLPFLIIAILTLFVALLITKSDISTLNLFIDIIRSAAGIFAGWITGRFITNQDNQNMFLIEGL